MYPDLNAARDLVNAGAAAVMPLASPIGSNKGLATKDFIQILIDEIELPIIVDAGIGRPSHACEAMEMGAACHHGQHCPRHSRKSATHGIGIQGRDKFRPKGLSGRSWKSSHQRGIRFRSMTGFLP